ncbi:hypothetical protein RF11_15125 [Thelohanellus kitauei]|uniref:Uncharacterized protein n=1 Tax=Thelohanellus kitauei TaxID=669202 RepID=A0A0C2MZB5_THEKT|nr:hypothetical protein RF11_15125 [Thelohanellus kitauei]
MRYQKVEFPITEHVLLVKNMSTSTINDKFNQSTQPHIIAGETVQLKALFGRLNQYIIPKVIVINTIHASINTTPSELFFERKLRTMINNLRPAPNDIRMTLKLHKKKDHYILGEVISMSGPLSYTINVERREEWKHADHMRTRTPDNNYHSPNQNEISAQPDAIISKLNLSEAIPKEDKIPRRSERLKLKDEAKHMGRRCNDLT